MPKTTATLAAALSAAWKANGVSSALAAAITQRKAATANTTARPLSPAVIDLEMEGWGIADSLSKEHAARNHIHPRGELIEIKMCVLALGMARAFWGARISAEAAVAES
ncbi:hypothetical protein BJA01nite_70730 [Bradyrhizobium japonicum]|nr:hypothetical protein BJA01nite_70730 [Bradyrhizobium japonicum]